MLVPLHIIFAIIYLHEAILYSLAFEGEEKSVEDTGSSFMKALFEWVLVHPSSGSLGLFLDYSNVFNFWI
jgi:hypothetical protein